MIRGGENRRPGFSLVELLVAMVILAILGCLVHAGFTSSREVAQQTRCTSNLRQIGAGLLLYCQAHNGQFPKTRHDAAASESWVYTLAPYTGDVDAIRIGPGDPKADQRLKAGLSSYVMNEYVAVVNQDYDFATGSFVVMEDYTNLMRLTRPAETITVFTGADDLSVDISRDHTHSRTWVGANAYAYARQDIQPDRHRGGANYLYADGHVAFITDKELRAIFASGVNPAKPPES